MIRVSALAVMAVFLCGGAFAAEKSKADEGKTAAAVVPAPTHLVMPQTMQVRVASIPKASPVEVRIVDAPRDDSTTYLNWATWGLLGATVFLGIVSLRIAGKQSREAEVVRVLGLRREVNRDSSLVTATAERLTQIAQQVPLARTTLSALSGRSLAQELKAEIDRELKNRTDRLEHIREAAGMLTGVDLASVSAEQLLRHLFQLDTWRAQMDAMRDQMTDELNRYESQSRELRERRAAIDAAAHAANLSRPLKDRLGE